METVATRPATPDDTAFARALHHRAYRGMVIEQFGAWDEAAQDRFFAQDWGNARFDIILFGSQPCGYAAVEDRPGDIHVRELVIDPGFQGRGIGTAILRSAMDRALARGVPVRLGALTCNLALKLYARLGFSEIGRSATHVFLEWRPPTPAVAPISK